jgi:putative aminopeptidase FrvX
VDKTELMLKELTEASGVSGYEGEVRAIIGKYFEPLGELSRDKLGSLVCKKQGSAIEPRVLIAGHMDEIGFMVKLITKEGFIKFTTLGGWPNQVLPAHSVVIQTNKGNVLGVIGSKPPHLMSEEERKKLVDKKDMFIDIGATSEKEVTEAGVRVGDPVVPLSQFNILSVPAKTYMSKAFDDRVGKNHPNTVFGAATVQEEVGVRGATTSVELVHPDVAIVLEVDIAGDVPGIKPEETAVKMGAGPTLLAYDARMIPNIKLRDLVIDTARELKLPLQVSAMEGGATDGSIIHLHRTGVPTVVLSVPTRHIHSHNSILRRDDYDATLKLAIAVVRKLDKKTVADLTAW